MKDLAKYIVITGCIVCMAGCEYLGGARAKRSSIAFVDGGSLSVWNNEMTAAIEYNSGQICMQRALSVVANDFSNTAEVPKAFLSLADALKTAADNGDEEQIAKLTTTLKETATLLTTSTERTTFLDYGMFYLCQISANGGLTDTQTAELIKIISLAGASINLDESEKLNVDNSQFTITPGVNSNTPRLIQDGI